MELPRPGSRKRMVFERLQQSGLDDALELATGELGLKEASVRSWMNDWRKGGLYGDQRSNSKDNHDNSSQTRDRSPANPSPRRAASLSDRPSGEPVDKGKRRQAVGPPGAKYIFAPSLAGRKGRIVAEGPQVSEVIWEDDGSRRFVPNDWLEEQRVRKREVI